MKKRIILITNSFPYGKGEISFVMPEIPFILEKFNLTIISKNSKDERTSDLDERIDVFRYDDCEIDLKFIIKNLKYIFSKDFIDNIIYNDFSVEKIIKSLKYTIRAKHFSDYVSNIRMKYKEPVIYYSYWNDYAAYGVARMAYKTSDKCISRIHGADLYKRKENGYYQPYKKAMSHYCDLIIFISNEGRDYFINNFNPEDSKKLIVQYLGTTKISERMNEILYDNVCRILTLSNLNEGKRVHRVAESLALIGNQKIEWTHIGDGSTEEYVKMIAKEKLTCKNNIKYDFKGRMSNKEVKMYFENNPVDLLINVSISEGLPVSMMEAASYGVPIIGTDVGGVKEIIQKNNGYLIDKDFKNKDLSDAIFRYCSLHNVDKKKMRNASYQIWEDSFKAEKNFRYFMEIIDKL